MRMMSIHLLAEMQFPRVPGANANAFDNNFTYNGPEAGHCATDLIYNLSREYKFEEVLPLTLQEWNYTGTISF